MAIKYVPKSQLIENQSSKIGQWVFEQSGIPYLGKYHLIKGQPFAGVTFDPTVEPRPLQKFNESKLYKILQSAGITSPAYIMALNNPESIDTLVSSTITSLPISQEVISDVDYAGGIRIFIQKTNENPKTIKEVKEYSPEHQIALQNPFYKVVRIDVSEDINTQAKEAEKEIPGISIFLGYQVS
jgi:hypothetical protein